MKLETPADAKALVEKICNWTLRGQIAMPVSTAGTNAILAFAKIIEDGEIDAKIRELEEKGEWQTTVQSGGLFTGGFNGTESAFSL